VSVVSDQTVQDVYIDRIMAGTDPVNGRSRSHTFDAAASGADVC
jgi:hypothetical protein